MALPISPQFIILSHTLQHARIHYYMLLFYL